jgi:hypothetical protein
MRYEDTVRDICGENWKVASPEEAEGGFGVACVKAYLRGCRPAVSDLAAHLSSNPGEVTPDQILPAYTRLVKSGVFSKDHGARRDHDLSIKDRSVPEYQYAWAQIAAIAGGFISISR